MIFYKVGVHALGLSFIEHVLAEVDTADICKAFFVQVLSNETSSAGKIKDFNLFWPETFHLAHFLGPISAFGMVWISNSGVDLFIIEGYIIEMFLSLFLIELVEFFDFFDVV